MAKKLWYKDGLRFECTQCGECCTGAPGLVQFTTQEGKEMASQLGLSEREFLHRYAQENLTTGDWELTELETEYGHDCILLDRCEDTGITRCRAHQSRPVQCRTWPFWPENLISKRTWKKAAQHCEGIGRGDFVPLRVIQREKDRTPPWGQGAY